MDDRAEALAARCRRLSAEARDGLLAQPEHAPYAEAARRLLAHTPPIPSLAAPPPLPIAPPTPPPLPIAALRTAAMPPPLPAAALEVQLFEQCLDEPHRQAELLSLAPPDLAARVRSLLGNVVVPPERRRLQFELLADRYTAFERLGSGGFGDVYKATRLTTGETVVIKFPQRPLSDGPAFLDEQRILSRLTDDRIARFLDSGEVAGLPYLVMEHVDGVHIDEYCRGKSVRQIVELFLQVVDAVAYAHRQPLMHRDLKPSNIMVTHAGQVKVLDFGLAKAVDAQSRQATTAYSRARSLPYSPPEQLESGDMTLGSDVFSLCAVLYELLAEVKVRDVPRPEVRRSQEKAYLALVRADLPPASSRALSPTRRRAIRGELDFILHKGLQPDRDGRYSSAYELGQDLRNYLATEPVTANPRFGARGYTVSRMVQRQPWVVAAVVLAVGWSLSHIFIEGWSLAQVQTEAHLGFRFREDKILQKDLIHANLSHEARSAGRTDRELGLALLRTWRPYLSSLSAMEPEVRSGYRMALACAWVDQAEAERALGDPLVPDSERLAVRNTQGVSGAEGIAYAELRDHCAQRRLHEDWRPGR